ncbi:MAG: hypothetical protein KOO62_13020 [candidate division Zixibacteria bacterium]|nr:hypothetical protein [candidate division Zixibacteria bacterium]
MTIFGPDTNTKPLSQGQWAYAPSLAPDNSDTLLSDELIREDTFYAELLCLLEIIADRSKPVSEKLTAVQDLILTYQVMIRALSQVGNPLGSAVDSYRSDIDYIVSKGFRERTSDISLFHLDPEGFPARVTAHRLINREWSGKVLDACIAETKEPDRAKAMRRNVARHRRPEFLVNDFLDSFPGLDVEEKAMIVVHAFKAAGVRLAAINPEDPELSVVLGEFLEHGGYERTFFNTIWSSFQFSLPSANQVLLNACWYTSRKVSEKLLREPWGIPIEVGATKESVISSFDDWQLLRNIR